MKTEHEKLMHGKFFNELNAKELVLFNDLIVSDEVFKKEYELLKELFENLKDKKSNDVRAKLDVIYNEMYSQKKEMKMLQLMKQNWYAIAASIAVLIMVGTYWFSGMNRQVWTEKIYNSYYEEDEVFVNTRSKANFNIDVLQQGMTLLENKDFSAALKEFNKLPNSITANYYAGVANMQLDNHNIAVAKFDYVIKDYLNLFYDQAQWYKGLCLVKLEKKDEATVLFEQISNTDSYFKDKAKQIVADLRKN